MRKRLAALFLVGTLLISSISVQASEPVSLDETSLQESMEVAATEELEPEEEEEEEEEGMDEHSEVLVEEYQNILGSCIATYASGDTYTTELAKFPADYQALLKELHKKHPNWVFKAVDTGLEWDDVVAGESYGTRSLTSKTYSDILLSKASGDYDPSTGKYIPKDGSSWVNVSDPGVAYFVDPRNYLNEQYIFAMEYLGYDETCHTLSGVESILTKTDLANKQIQYTNTSGKTVVVKPALTYGESILAAGIKQGISPLSLAARIKQETGGGLSYGGLSGTYSYGGKSYQGYYNYYNIGSSADTSKPPLVNGMEYAIKAGWTSPMLAIDGGAQFLTSSYISRGQNTVYFQKFNTVYKPYYSHQYMQNITAPLSEGNNTYLTYQKLGNLDSSFVFYIPVYKNMPSQTAGVTISKNVKTAKIIGGVNLRTGPATTYPSQTSIPAGETVTVSGGVFTDDTVAYGQKLSNPYWMKVTYGKYTGYISSNYFEMDTSITINKGSTNTLKLSSAPSGEMIYYETSDPAVATVSSKGVVTGVGAGTCMIYAVTSSGQSLDAVGISVLDKLDTPTLKSAANTTSGINVSWGKVSGAEGYYVYRKTSGGSWSKIATVKSGSTVSYIDTTAKSGTTYIYTVRAYVGTTLSGYVASGVTMYRLTEPTISVVSASEKEITLKWTKVTGAEGYYLYRRDGTSGDWTRIANIKGEATITYTYKGSNSLKKEYFTVKAYKGDYVGSHLKYGVVERMKLDTPKLVSAANEAAGIRITWNKVTNAEGYNVYRKVSGESWKRIAKVKSSSREYFLDETAAMGTKYSYTIRAYAGNNLSAYNTSGVTASRLAEPAVKVEKISTNSVSLKWTNISGAEGYYVYRRVGTSGSWKRIAIITGAKNVTYTYQGTHDSTTKEYFTVRAYAGTSLSTYMKPGAFARVKVAKTTLVSAKNSNTGIKVTWNKVASAEGYNVYRKVSGGSWKKIKVLSSGSTVEYTDTTAAFGTKYIYTVRAFVGENIGAFDAAGVSMVRLAEPKVSVSNLTTNSVKINWTKVSGADGYYVYRRVGTSGGWKTIATIKDVDTLTCTYQGTHNSSTKEYFTVKAFKDKDVGSYPNPGAFARVNVGQPDLVSAQNSSAGVKVTWKKVTGVAGYNVYRKTAGGSWKKIAKIKSSSRVYFVDETAASGTTYIYTVRAYIGENLSGYDKTGVKTLYLCKPTVKVGSVTSSSVKVSWTKVPGATGYYIFRRSGTTGKWTHVATAKDGSTTSCTVSGLAKSTKYYFTVKAFNGSTYSTYPDPGVSATTSSVEYTTYKTTDGVNYRTGPGTSYSKGGTLVAGTKVQVENGYSKNADGYTWYRVKVDSKNYYIASKYLKKA